MEKIKENKILNFSQKKKHGIIGQIMGNSKDELILAQIQMNLIILIGKNIFLTTMIYKMIQLITKKKHGIIGLIMEKKKAALFYL